MNQPVYLDYCATTPIHPDVRAAMRSTLEEAFGNPSSMHWAGRLAAQMLDQARSEVALGLGCQSDEIFFTSGATEADNLALLGFMRQYQPGKAHLITSAVEHHAVLHAAQQLEREGYSVTYLPVDSQGLIDPATVQAAISGTTVLISVMMVNNEVGSIQPVAEIGAIAHQKGVLFHSDVVQGIGLLNVDVKKIGVDLLSLSAHKIYGPKGVGALYVRQGVSVTPTTYGGHQERSLRAGTENTSGIVGLGAAVRLVSAHKAAEHPRLHTLRQQLTDGLQARIPGATINGPQIACSPHIVSVSFPGADAEMMLIRLNGEGIAVSLGSACTSKSIEPSHVLTSMGLPPEQIEGTLRISLGFPTTPAEIDRFLEVIPQIYHRAVLA
jgi:cysteine desulfurase